MVVRDNGADLERILKGIVNDARMELLYQLCRHNVTVHFTPRRTLYGRESLLAGLAAFLASFPDASLTVEEILEGEERGRRRPVSVLWTLNGSHSGWGLYGKPGGKPVSISGIVLAHMDGDRIAELWMEVDEETLLRQLDLDPEAVVALRLDSAPPAWIFESDSIGEIDRLNGQLAPDIGDLGCPPRNPAEKLVSGLVHDVWNRRGLSVADSFFADGAASRFGSGATLPDGSSRRRCYLAVLSGFPDCGILLDDLFSLERDAGTVVVLRWSLMGTHRGPGYFGAPGFVRVRMTGLSHFRVSDGKIVDEFSAFDLMMIREALEEGRRRHPEAGYANTAVEPAVNTDTEHGSDT